MKQIRVLIVDDSSLIRRMFTELLESDPAITVVDTAFDPYDAREKIKALQPDVITLDIEMPKMDGLSFLEKIMTLRPMPVVMVSSLTQKGAEATLKALELGAVDYVPKSGSRSFDADALKDDLIQKVKAAARAQVKAPGAASAATQERLVLPDGAEFSSQQVVALGASTGGVEALKEVVRRFPPNFPPVLITQHMPAAFTGTFAKRMDGVSALSCKEAESGDRVQAGHLYLAPGDRHMVLKKDANGYYLALQDTEPVSGHKPSVDVMFESVAAVAKQHAVGGILTGMGKDGAAGLLAMKKAGSFTVGQDEASCIVYGMPKAAWLAGAVEEQAPLNKIAKTLLKNMV